MFKYRKGRHLCSRVSRNCATLRNRSGSILVSSSRRSGVNLVTHPILSDKKQVRLFGSYWITLSPYQTYENFYLLRGLLTLSSTTSDKKYSFSHRNHIFYICREGFNCVYEQRNLIIFRMLYKRWIHSRKNFIEFLCQTVIYLYKEKYFVYKELLK